MKLNILSWNTNYIHDNWFKRIKNINKEIKRSQKKYHIIALQEAILPFSDAIHDIYNFLKQNPNISYFPSAEFFIEKNFIYEFIKNNFPKYKLLIIKIFEFCMNKILYLCCFFYSKYGEFFKSIYFKYPYICIGFIILCPIIFIVVWFFFGMLTILNKKIKGTIQTKYVGRMIQYTEFTFNKKKILFVNIHLLHPKAKERLLQIKNIHKFIKNKKKDIFILAGDFNSTPNSNVYKFLKKKNYKSVINEFCGKEHNTFPAKNPDRCIDYIWIKGSDYKIIQAKTFGNYEATDHKGIKTTIDIS